MIQRLSSLTLTLYALSAVVLCLIAGMILAQAPPYSGLMPEMDQELILDWLLASLGGQGSAVLTAWFLALCAAVGLLVVNLCACTWTRLLPLLKNGARLHAWLLVLAHVLMVVILLGHLSQMTLGFKLEGVKLLPGQGRELPGGLRLAVEDLYFADDPALLNLTYRQGRRAQTVEAFHRAANWVLIALWRDGQEVERGRLRILEPLSAQGLRLTLSDFYRDDERGQVGAVFTVIRNPLTNLFFGAYLAWIAVYLLLTVHAFVRGANAKPTEAGA